MCVNFNTVKTLPDTSNTQNTQQKAEVKNPETPKDPQLCNQATTEPKDGVSKSIKNALKEGIKPVPDNIKGHFDEIFQQIAPSPEKVVEKIRNSKGKDQVGALISFQNTIDKMTKEDLKDMRDYLVKSMADPNNKDDELLGELLKSVNKELDSRGSSRIIWNEIHPSHDWGGGGMVEKYSCSFSTRKTKI
ncbi:MAG: hypothetical protein U0457_14115 [Candidatus Sericytochromatia bacterium]